MMNENKEARKGRKRVRRKEDERAAVVCAVAVVARRRSEGTHPINKTTRVTIEFNREKNGFQSAKRARGARGREGIPEVNPRARMRHYCLLFRTSIPNGWRSAGDSPTRGRERAREKWREKRGNGRKTVFANGSTAPSEFVFFVEVNDTDFIFFPSKTIQKAQLRSQDRKGR